ncbi:GNAT family N-acetyltransferase [Peribacillus frigoritolerans]|uniref:GNAT family N-acetyltransferase n=1 Tax=Peribacillus frigoritolerans TaxID=450367 RepID=UPI00105AA27B|nr:GNAT family N-acetyltransferase [Peribacillus frigoritolerans]TDL80339.1 GNAT family N-acetyltransferase [Peribacillus frigoritolerans]
MQIQLHPITKHNWETCISLKVHKEQERFVAGNLYSLAESKFETSFLPLGIYEDNKMIGFAMVGKDPEDGVYWLVRFMIDKDHQGKGYGFAALQIILSFMKSRYDVSPFLLLGVTPENTQAIRLYQKAGFIDTGKKENGEAIFRLELY